MWLDVLFSVDGRKTFHMPASLLQLTAAAGTYSNAFHWTWDDLSPPRRLADITIA
jgi:hypothetical protein